MNINNIEWVDETVEFLKQGNWLYKFICFCLGRRKKKLTYKEIYIILVEVNRKKLGDEKAKTLSMEKIIQFYKDTHNNKLPNGIE